MSALFDLPELLPGLKHVELGFAGEIEQALIARFDSAGLAPFRFQGWTGKRLTASFGWRYDFDDTSFTPGPPLPRWLIALREDVVAQFGLDPRDFVQALLTHYDAGAGIGWHRDRPVFDRVIGISLGARATMRFRRRRPMGGFDRVAVPLAPGSAYLLSGEARHGWEHSIAPMDAPRWSITLRSLA